MKKIHKNKITNIVWTNRFDNKFLFEVINPEYQNDDIQVIFMSELLEKKKNLEILEKVWTKPAMYSNVYSPKDELEIFRELFKNAIKNKKKVHIVWTTLKEEIEMLEEYYETLWFLREEINCFAPDFSVPLVTVSVNIENLMWKGSDYKRMWKKIFFNPPVRESGQTKAMYKWINRWVTAGIYIKEINKEVEEFLSNLVKEEKIIAINLAKVLKYNLEEIGFKWESKNLIIEY